MALLAKKVSGCGCLGSQFSATQIPNSLAYFSG